MRARRSMSLGGTVLVGVIAGAASYTHMREVAVATHQGALIGALLPLSVDGLILVATLAIGDGRTSTLSAWLAFILGVTASLAANIAAADPSPAARIVSAWPSLAFLLSVEVLLRHRRQAAAPSLTPAEHVTTVPVTGHDNATVTGHDNATVTGHDNATVTGHDGATTAPRTAAAGVTASAASRTTTPVSRAATTTSATRIAATRRQNPDATIVQIAAKAHVSESTVRRYLAKSPPPDGGTTVTPPDP